MFFFTTNMSKSFFSLLSTAGPRSVSCINNKTAQPCNVIRTLAANNFSSLSLNRNEVKGMSLLSCTVNSKKDFLKPNEICLEQSRTKAFINCSWTTGEKETDMDVIERFYRLNTGNWIRTMAKRNTRIYQKSCRARARSLKHVFCNQTQCKTLDRMVSKYWKQPKYFIKDPYAPYEWRENFDECRTKPWRPHGCDYE